MKYAEDYAVYTGKRCEAGIDSLGYWFRVWPVIRIETGEKTTMKVASERFLVN